jgi:hypothetical protein
MDTTMAKEKRTRESGIAEPSASTPNPKDKKAPRSILKGKVPEGNEDKTMKNKEQDASDMKNTEKDASDAPISSPPHLKRDIKSNLDTKFLAADNNNNNNNNNNRKTNEESTAKNHKNQSSNDEVTEEKEADNKNKQDKTNQDKNKHDDDKNYEDNTNDKDNDNDNKNNDKVKGEGDGNDNKQGEQEGGQDEGTDEDADKMDVDKYCLDFHSTGYKRHTSEWNAVTEGVMKASKILTLADESYITDVLEDVMDEEETELNKMDKYKWIKIFISTKDISAARNRKRFIRVFGVSLARSDPKGLFNREIFDGNKLLETTTTNAWAAAYTVYGPGWLHATIEPGPKVQTPTPLYKTCTEDFIMHAKPFLADEVYDDNPDSLHNLEITMKKLCRLKIKGKAVIEPDAWAEAITKAFHHPMVKKVCLRLAKTPATIFKELDLVTGTELHKVAITTLWTGAYQLLGQITDTPQVQEETTPKPKQPIPAITPTEADKEEEKSAVKFTPETKVAKKAGNRLFISKDKPKPSPTTTKISKRKYNGYYKVKLPATVNEFGIKAVEETTLHFSKLTEIIWSIDKKAEVLPWYDNTALKPLIKGSSELKTKEQLNRYTPNVYIAQGKNTWLRFHIAHDVAKDKFIETEEFTNAKLQVSYDKVQAQKTSIWGWMLGGIPESANLNDMKEACENHPLLNKFQIEARSQVIKVFSGRQDTPVHLQVKAIHIIGDDRLTAQGRKAFNKVFGSRNDTGYPQQRVMRFVPNVADNRFPATQSRVKDVVKMMGKQKKIIKDARIIYTDTISSLHFYVPQIGYTLCQILMSMRSANDRDTQLFMAVDERTYGSYAVSLTVHKDRLAEATSLAPLLNIILEAKFGHRIWEWFCDTAKDASQGYVYDAATGRIKNMDEEDDDDESSIDSEENEFVAELSERLNLVSGKDTEKGDLFDIDLSFMLDDENPKNQYGDSGSVRTFRSACRPKKTIDMTGTSDEEESDQDSDQAKHEGKSTQEKNTSKEQEIDSPGDMSVDTSQTQETSTLSDSMNDPEQAFKNMCIKNPDFLARFLKSNPEIKAIPTPSGESKTPAKTQDPQEASTTKGDEASL